MSRNQESQEYACRRRQIQECTFPGRPVTEEQSAEPEDQTFTGKIHSADISEEKLEERLSEHFRTTPILTRKKFEELFHLTTPTACRTIRKLVEAQRLKNIGTPHHPVYIALPGHFGQ